MRPRHLAGAARPAAGASAELERAFRRHAEELDRSCAFAVEHQIILAHEIVDEKSNEIPAVQTLIATLGLNGRVFTLDAMHCQKNLRDRPRHRQ